MPPRARPELVLMDVRMPGMDGLTATRAIKEQFPNVIVMMLTVCENQDYLLEAIRAGATAYVLKDASPSELTAAIRKALGGEISLHSGLATQLLLRLVNEVRGPSKLRAEAEQSEPSQSLTPRELEVLGLLALGQINREIARGLGISLSTVKRHLENVASKLEVSDRTQVVVRAIEQGIIPFPRHRNCLSTQISQE